MKITTIKLQKNTKNRLDKHKAANESYDEVIKELMRIAEQMEMKKKLIEYYQSLGKNDLDLLREWEVASNEL